MWGFNFLGGSACLYQREKERKRRERERVCVCERERERERERNTRKQWSTTKPNLISIHEDDPFSFDTFNKGHVSSSSSDDEETFTIPATRQPTTIPSTVYVDDYEWDIGEPKPKT